MLLDKFISYRIESQFPSIYKEDGQELISFVKAYYDFLQNRPGQAVYNSRRLFEFKDIDSTLPRMLIFFKNKYLNELPLNEESVRFAVKHILDLYRRKGTREGLELFFKLFYDESASVYYPSKAILKPSASIWKTGKFLRLYPNDPNVFKDALNQRIYGRSSKAEAVAETIYFIIINNTIYPIIQIEDVNGQFIRYDDIVYKVGNTEYSIGKVYGSLSSVSLVENPTINPAPGNEVGDIVYASSENGSGAKFVVTEVSEDFDGRIRYTIEDGGFGFSKENTRLLVSDQIIFLNTNETQPINTFDILSDRFGNFGTVIGRKGDILGVRMDPGEEFTTSSVIINETLARLSGSNTEISYVTLSQKNNTSPGPLYPEEANTALASTAVKLEVIKNNHTIFNIEDLISDYLFVPLNAANYNDPPALKPMSGTANPVTLSTPLSDAFDLVGLEMGTIVAFKNVRPGTGYINNVFALAYDPVVSSLNSYDQILSLNGGDGLFRVGDEVSQGALFGKIKRVVGNTIYVRPYSILGFDLSQTILHKGNSYTIIGSSRDYSSKQAGYNAIILTNIFEATGTILNTRLINSGYGYVDQDVITLVNEFGDPLSEVRVNISGQGIQEGRNLTYTSHLNAENGKVLQDSFFYQDYSYEVSSKLNINTYEKDLKDNMHPAGTKFFGRFGFVDAIKANTNIILAVEG